MSSSDFPAIFARSCSLPLLLGCVIFSMRGRMYPNQCNFKSHSARGVEIQLSQQITRIKITCHLDETDKPSIGSNDKSLHFLWISLKVKNVKEVWGAKNSPYVAPRLIAVSQLGDDGQAAAAP